MITIRRVQTLDDTLYKNKPAYPEQSPRLSLQENLTAEVDWGKLLPASTEKKTSAVTFTSGPGLYFKNSRTSALPAPKLPLHARNGISPQQGFNNIPTDVAGQKRLRCFLNQSGDERRMLSALTEVKNKKEEIKQHEEDVSFYVGQKNDYFAQKSKSLFGTLFTICPFYFCQAMIQDRHTLATVSLQKALKKSIHELRESKKELGDLQKNFAVLQRKLLDVWRKELVGLQTELAVLQKGLLDVSQKKLDVLQKKLDVLQKKVDVLQTNPDQWELAVAVNREIEPLLSQKSLSTAASNQPPAASHRST